MKCPKCHRKLIDRGYALVCFRCDCCVVLDIFAFVYHWSGGAFCGEFDSSTAAVNQDHAAQLED